MRTNSWGQNRTFRNLTGSKARVTALIAFAMIGTAGTVRAQLLGAGEGTAEGYLVSKLLGDSLEYDYGIKVNGLMQLGFSKNNVFQANISGRPGNTNFPVAAPEDEGFQFNAVQIFIHKDMETNILPGITPIPAPIPDSFSWGFDLEPQYGRNGQPSAMYGFDQNWAVNAPGNTNPGLASINRQNFVSVPQAKVTFFLPVAQGIAFTLGRFASGVGFEIPPAVRPTPNFFYSRTYAFVAQPDQVAGARLSANLYRGANGLLAFEGGIVQGWQNWQDNNDQKAYIGAFRWRSLDMKTWVDYSFMTGASQSSPGHPVQMPTSTILSSNSQNRQHHSFAISNEFDQKWKFSGEIVYGRQNGDGQPGTLNLAAPVPVSGFAGAKYSGINLHLAYREAPDLAYGVRLEHFKATDGFGLFPVTAVKSDFNDFTVGLRYDLNKFILLRPEIRYDWQGHNDGVNAFGANNPFGFGGTASKQVTVSMDLVAYF